MKNLLTAIFIIISFVYQTSAQFSNDVDGKYSVSDYNGNLTYTYPISNNSVDGYPISVNLIYNGNVKHTNFLEYHKDSSGFSNWIFETVLKPTWMIEVNGFALEVLGKRETFANLGQNIYDSTLITTVNNSIEKKGYWIIEGYDYCNPMREIIGNGDQDVITILRADGSLLELRNVTAKSSMISNYDSRLYTGYYHENVINTNGFAIVEYDSTYWSEHFKQGIPGFPRRNAYIPRKVKYYPGDGLEYVFFEHTNPYGKKIYQTMKKYTDPGYQLPQYPINYSQYYSNIPENVLPRIFYLIEINSANRRLTKFKRSWHNFDAKSFLGDTIDMSRGHGHIIEMDNHKFSYGDREIILEVFDRTLKFEYMPDYVDQNSETSSFYSSGLRFPWDKNHGLEEHYGTDNTKNDIFFPTFYKTGEESWSSDSAKIGFNSVISSIIDPANRVTRFKYYHKVNAFVSNYYSNYYNYLRGEDALIIDSIIEPTKAYCFKYFQSDQAINYSIIDQSVPDIKLSPVVASVSILDKKEGGLTEKISEIFYTWFGDGSNYRRSTVAIVSEDIPIQGISQIYKENVTNDIVKKYLKNVVEISSIYYHYFKAPIQNNTSQPFLSSAIKVPILTDKQVSTYAFINDSTIIRSSDVANYSYNDVEKYKYNLVFEKNYFIKDSIKLKDLLTTMVENLAKVKIPLHAYEIKDTLVAVDSVTYHTLNNNRYSNYQIIDNWYFRTKQILSLKETCILKDFTFVDYFYTFETVNNFGGQIGYENTYGRALKSITTRYTKYIDSTRSFSYKKYSKFLNLKHFKTLINRTNKEWNWLDSKFLTNTARRMGQKRTLNIFNEYVFNDSIIVPPKYGLLTNEMTYAIENYDEYTLGGYEKEYDTIFTANGNPNSRYGAVINEKAIDRDRNSYLIAEYGYNNKWNKNLLNYSKNSIGAESRMYYNYADAGFVSDYPIGKKINNQNEIIDEILYREKEEFELPAVNEQIVRKLNFDGSIRNETLRTITERSYFGQKLSEVDMNGWYYRYAYDNNGRNTYTWHPFDFPVNDLPADYSKCQIIDDFNFSLYKKRYRKILRDSTFDFIIHSENDLSDVADVVDRKFVGVSFVEFDEPVQVDDSTTVMDNYLDRYDHKLNFIYTAQPEDIFHSNSETKLFKLSYVNNDNSQDIALKLSSKEPSFDCIVLIQDDDESQSENSKVKNVLFDLRDIQSHLANLEIGRTVEFTLEVVSDNGLIEVLTNSDDEGSSFCTKNQNIVRNDYTFSYIYDDFERSITKRAKIDDALHTSNKLWSNSFNLDGRVTQAKDFYRAGNKSFKSYLTIGNPSSPTRTDSVITKQVYLAGNYMKSAQVTDQLGYQSYSTVKNNGTVEVTNNNGNSKTVVTTYLRIDQLPDNIRDIDFFGYAKKETITNEAGNKLVNYYDAFGNLRAVCKQHPEFEDQVVTTKYFYNIIGELQSVIAPNNDTTFYHYDNWGRVKYKYNSNVGYISYSYDISGNIRFTQNEEQFENSKLSFFQYDDLNRPTIIGEAKVHGRETNNPEYYGYGIWYFNRLTDIINPNILNYPRFEPPLTVNRTLWSNTSFNPPSYVGKSDFVPFRSYYDSTNTLPIDTFIVNRVWDYYLNIPPVSAPLEEIEDIENYPEFVKTSILYDDISIFDNTNNLGKIWSNIPNPSDILALMPQGQAQNLKGQKSAIAYRDTEDEPFNYVFFSYDPRGRITAIVRHTDNIGFDAVYYTYNSMNKVIKVKTVDALRQHITWMSYDNNGRLYKVYSHLDTLGSGFGFGNNLALQEEDEIPSMPDITYTYNKRGGVDKVDYSQIDISQQFVYNPAGWLDSLIATRNLSEIIFKEVLQRNQSGLIKKQASQHLNQPQRIQTYHYDLANQMYKWVCEDDSLEYDYDEMGNIRGIYGVYGSDNYTHYRYDDMEHTNRTTAVNTSKFEKAYSYNSNGAVTGISTKNKQSGQTDLETFSYLSSGMLKEYSIRYDDQNIQCLSSELADVRWIYGYRYSPFGGREQKRLKYSPYADACEYTHDWTYYQEGAFGENLAIYAGRQTFDEYGSYYGRPGRYVSFYAAQYVVDGGNLAVLADGTKEYSIKDHLGSVRVVASTNGQLRQYDYKPYGDTLQSGSYNNLRGYEGSERDPESRYMNLGARLYDPIIGRFLSVDPLWEAFPSWSPYQYAYNCPVSYKDPTGLAPQKEKGDRILRNDNFMLSYSEASKIIMAGQNKTVWDDQKVFFRLAYEIQQANHKRIFGDDFASGSNYGRTQKKNESEWVWNGVDYGSREALIEATQNEPRKPGTELPFTTDEVVCEADRYVESNDYSSIMDFLKSMNEGLEYSAEIYQNDMILGFLPNTKSKPIVVPLAKSIGKNIGYLTLGVGVSLELVDSFKDQSASRTFMDISAQILAYKAGGLYGIAFGIVYEGLMYEFNDRRHIYYGFTTGNIGLFPADETKTRQIYK